MVTKIMEIGGNKTAVDAFNHAIRPVAEFFGLSTDTKPASAKNADIFYEMDTQKVSLFNEAGGTWLEQ